MAEVEVQQPQDIGSKSFAEAAQAPPPSDPPITNGLQKNSASNGGPINGDVTTPGEYEGSGLYDAPSSPVKFGHKKTSSRGSVRSSGSAKDSGDGQNIVFEKYGDGEGAKLTSVEPSKDYERNLTQGEKERKPNSDTKTKGELELVSGRQAAAGWERSGIRFAPLNVPLKRRLQTLVVLLHTLSAVSLLTIFFLLCAIPLLWPILVPYLVYVLLSDAGTNGELRWRSETMRRSKVWSLFASYFPARLHRTEVLPPTRKYIFGYHPHGIISHGAFSAFSTEALGFSQLFPGITNTLLTLDSNFRIPLYRDYILMMGLRSVSRESIHNLLSKGGPNGEGMGRAITIVVGGARESLEANPGAMRLVLGQRKGFVKMAIREGADLVPVMAFGENDIYEQIDSTSHPKLHKFQLMVKKSMGFTLPVFHARGIFNYDVGIMPYRRPINVVVGRPIRIEQQRGKPDDAYVDQVHQRYIEELRCMWDQWKDVFAKERVGEFEILD